MGIVHGTTVGDRESAMIQDDPLFGVDAPNQTLLNVPLKLSSWLPIFHGC